MDKFVVTKNEWHYKLLRLFMRHDFNIQYSCKDFCSYWRMLVLLLILAIVLFLIGAAILSYLVFSTIFTLLLHPFYGWISSFEHQFFVGTVLTGVFTFVGSVVLLWRRYEWGSKIAAFFEDVSERMDKRRIERNHSKRLRMEEEGEGQNPPSIFRQWLRNTRDKVCVGIEYVNEK